MPSKALVIDANILVRAVLGRRVREIIEPYAEHASFFVPEVAYAEAEEHVPTLVSRRAAIRTRRPRSCAPCAVR